MFLSLLTAILRFFLRLRYRVEISGLDQLQTPQPIVVLPNHPALVDPLLLLSFLGRYWILSPVMTESYFSTHPIDLEEAHAHMRSRGVPNLVAISENIVLPEILLLGTGKVDYRGLKGMI